MMPRDPDATETVKSNSMLQARVGAPVGVTALAVGTQAFPRVPARSGKAEAVLESE